MYTFSIFRPTYIFSSQMCQCVIISHIFICVHFFHPWHQLIMPSHPPRRPVPHALRRRRQPLAGARQPGPQVQFHRRLGIRRRLPRHDPAQLLRQLAALEETLREPERGSQLERRLGGRGLASAKVFCPKRLPFSESKDAFDESAAIAFCNRISCEWNRNWKDYVVNKIKCMFFILMPAHGHTKLKWSSSDTCEYLKLFGNGKVELIFLLHYQVRGFIY